MCRTRERTRAPGHAPASICAAAGTALATVPGVDVPYEVAMDPELVVDTAIEEPTRSVVRVLGLARTLSWIAPPREAPAAAGWALDSGGRVPATQTIERVCLTARYRECAGYRAATSCI